MKIILQRVKLFLMEIVNLITDLLVPVVDLLVAIATLLPIPTKYVLYLHKLVDILKGAGAKIDDIIDIIKEHKNKF